MLSGVVRVGDLEIDPVSRDVRVAGTGASLSQKEFALLLALAAQPTRVFTKEPLRLQAVDCVGVDPYSMRATDGGGGGGDDDGFGGIAVGGALLLVVAGVYQASQSSQVSETTAYIAGVVAIAVALITWFATDRRQGKALATERIRLQLQLDHDRDVPELAELRAVLDDATRTLNSLNMAVGQLRWHWGRLRQDSSEAAVTEFKSLSQEIGPLIDEAEAAWYRLTLRVGPEYEAVPTFRAVTTALRDMYNLGDVVYSTRPRRTGNAWWSCTTDDSTGSSIFGGLPEISS